MSPKYSFVLPAYKATFFREAIDSILNQTYKDFELIIVNDASPEDLNSIVNSYHDERIRYYVNEKNIGGTDLVAQWNHCIAYATGDYLILASDDDVYHFDYLKKMDALIDKYPNVNVFRPRIQYINSNGMVVDEASALLEEMLTEREFVLLREKGMVSSGIPYYIFRREVLIKIGGFVNLPSAWFSDDATVIILARNNIVNHNEILFSFRISGLNISSMLNSSSMLVNKLLATESFFLWFSNELDRLIMIDDCMDEDLVFIKKELYSRKMTHMLQLICASHDRRLLPNWHALRCIRTLGIVDCIIICCRLMSRNVMEKLGF